MPLSAQDLSDSELETMYLTHYLVDQPVRFHGRESIGRVTNVENNVLTIDLDDEAQSEVVSTAFGDRSEVGKLI